jgi:L-arabinonolactonase
MVHARLIETIDTADILGESVIWRDSDQTVWWTDIHGRRIHRLDWPSLSLSTFPVPERACALAFVEGRDDILLVAFESGFALFKPESGQCVWLARPPALGPGMRLNDGRVDPQGRFWCGGKDEGAPTAADMPAGVLYRLGAEGEAGAILGGLHISNGLGWTRDGRRMFLAESARGEVYAAPFDAASGVPGRLELFARFENESPDGATVDAAGNYWTALWGGARVACLSPDGVEIASVEVAAPQPSCPVFGGPGCKLLFVTSARDGLDQDALAASPHSGGLFVFETSATGRPETRARLNSSILSRF